MKRPSLRAYVLGNPAVVIGLWIGTAVLTYKCFHDNVLSPLPAILVGLASLTASRDCAQLTKYHRWKREWDAMSGVPPKPPLLSRAPGLGLVMAILAWSGVAVFVGEHQDEPDYRVAAGWFWIATGVIILVLLFRGLRWLAAQRRRSSPERPVDVTVLVGMPSESPTPAQAMAAIPEYCRRLLTG
jgi:hypothetical protein